MTKFLGLFIVLISVLISISGAAALPTDSSPEKTKKKKAKPPVTTPAPERSAQGHARLNDNTMNEGNVTHLKVPDEKPVVKRKIPFSASNQFSMSTIVFNHSLQDGDRTNYAVMSPGLSAGVTENVTAYGNIPFTWGTDQDEKVTMRGIGRPELGAISNFKVNENLNLGPTMSVKLPLYDYSMADGEQFRVWRFAPGMQADLRVKDSPFHVFGATSVAYDTDAKLRKNAGFTTSTDNEVIFDYTIDKPVTVRGTLGVAHKSDNMTIGSAFHSINGIGMGHAKISSAALRDEFKMDLDPVDLSSIEVFGNFKVQKNTSINASVSKGLKNVDNANGFSSMLSSFDSIPEIAYLGVSVGLTQSF
jgi:hypothetical protein